MQIETEKVILTKGNEKRPCTDTNIYICSIIVSDQVQWNSVAAWHDVCLQASAKSRSISYSLSAPARSQGRKGSSSGHRSHTGVASASVPTQTPEVHERCFRRTRWSDYCTTCISSGHACWHSRWGQWRTCSHTCRTQSEILTSHAQATSLQHLPPCLEKRNCSQIAFSDEFRQDLVVELLVFPCRHLMLSVCTCRWFQDLCASSLLAAAHVVLRLASKFGSPSAIAEFALQLDVGTVRCDGQPDDRLSTCALDHALP